MLRVIITRIYERKKPSGHDHHITTYLYYSYTSCHLALTFCARPALSVTSCPFFMAICQIYSLAVSSWPLQTIFFAPTTKRLASCPVAEYTIVPMGEEYGRKCTLSI